MADAALCPIIGPSQLRVRRASWSGPFARGDAVLGSRGTRFTVVNAGLASCVIDSFSLDPLRRCDTGASVVSVLSLTASTPVPTTLPAGGRLELELDGEVPAQAGSYASVARIRLDGGASLAVPVFVDVAAAPLWGVACMLLGLCLLGTVNLLAGEGSVNTRLHDALQARQDIQPPLPRTSVSRHWSA